MQTGKLEIKHNPKRFYVRSLPTVWINNADDISLDLSWKLFETLSKIVLIDSISVLESKFKSFYGIVNVLRKSDVDKLLACLDEKDRFFVADEKCHMTIRQSSCPVQPSRVLTVKIAYNKQQLLALRASAATAPPPRIVPSLYAQIGRRCLAN
uniref:Uncharacterized protein n=1 Tax=Ditylenchus dipsaci TaxID=166011 RepID=A0A915DPF4_9BILA